ncbi:MAG: AAA family ATPase [Chloroflexi bacterium]|nr:AAA family ATPase [Chloroflexota bacterium]
MDGGELARQSAAQLHAEVVGLGNDPWRVFEFAKAAAGRRGYDVEPIAPGAALLNGARAALDAENQLILYEGAGSLFDKAFLIAHEVGHAAMGDAHKHDAPCEIDPTRVSEPSPVGLDRVVDYGPRQRREVQMDLFAREFLLPRDVVRRLHLEEGLTASDIAARIGAPYDFVAQQMLDALLLPAIAPKPEIPSLQHAPNAEQAAAASHRGAAHLLEAGPGTGKTETLANRVRSLLAEGVDPKRILLLTFSNKAAGEMADRIARTDKTAAGAMWIGTFHAFGLDIIRRFHTEMGLERDPGLIDRTEAVELLENEFPRLDLQHYRNVKDPTQHIADMLAAVSRAKDEVVDERRYAALAADMVAAAITEEEKIAAEKAVEVATLYAAYEKLKRGRRRIDFGDLVMLPVRLLETNAAVRQQLATLYDHILVDEYQDVNRSSVRLLTALKPDGLNLWAVGDAKQSIYRFRGASSFNMDRFGNQDFPGGQRGRLKRNYRSVSEIVQAFSIFSVTMKVGDEDSGLIPDRPPTGAKPEARLVRRAPMQAPLLAATIQEMIGDGHKFSDQAVLCTGNDKLSETGSALEKLGIPVLYLGNLFERPEVKDLLSVLSLLSDRRAMGLLRTARWDEFAANLQDVQTVLDRLRQLDLDPMSWRDDIAGIESLSVQARDNLLRLHAALARFDETSSPWTVLATLLLDRTRRAATLAGSSEIAERSQAIAIWQLMNFLKVQPYGSPFPIYKLLERIRRLVRLGDERDLRQLPAAAQGIDAVRLMTIHGAKGLEFGVVHVPGMNVQVLPRTPPKPACLPPVGMIEGSTDDPLTQFKTGQAQEQECIFYVAVSRAKDRLFFYALTEKSNGVKYGLSPFLGQLGVIEQKPPAATVAAASTDSDDISLVVDGPLRFTADQIGLYESCPRRFFYTHILRIGGRRSETPYMRLHEAVRDITREVIAAPSPIDGPGLDLLIAREFSAHGLSDHGYAADFLTIARQMIDYLVISRTGYQPAQRDDIVLAFSGDEITIRPDDVLLDAAAQSHVRRVSTGHKRSYETDGVAPAGLVIAAQKAFPGAAVQLINLADNATTPLSFSSTDLAKAQQKIVSLLTDVRAGRFPAKPSPRTCPGCPAYFVCGLAPTGPLQKKF